MPEPGVTEVSVKRFELDRVSVTNAEFRKLSKGMCNHSSIIAVLDRRGVIAERIDGITPGDPKLGERVRRALGQAAV